MFAIMLFLASGIILGVLVKHNKAVIKITDNLTTWVICLLLFSLGTSIGGNEKITGNLSNLGMQSIVLTTGAVAGSVIVSYFVYRYFFRGEGER
ncbi:MAG: LysO family transporter [Thermodesulfobacteriota bacterium]|nr:LysO family transporter [Thermodesulfobacteriota bacterium]